MGKGYLIDTNTVIEFMAGILPNAGKIFLLGIEPAISVITFIELFSSNATPEKESLQLSAFANASTVYNIIDEKIVSATINIRKKNKTKTPDAIIAATAIVNGLTLITRNKKDFRNIENLVCIDPWEI